MSWEDLAAADDRQIAVSKIEELAGSIFSRPWQPEREECIFSVPVDKPLRLDSSLIIHCITTRQIDQLSIIGICFAGL
jgi:hypothetical protein